MKLLKNMFRPKEVKLKEQDRVAFENSERFHEIFTELTHRHNRAVSLKQYDKLRKMVGANFNFNLDMVRKINNRVALKDLETERIIDIFEMELRKK